MNKNVNRRAQIFVEAIKREQANIRGSKDTNDRIKRQKVVRKFIEMLRETLLK